MSNIIRSLLQCPICQTGAITESNTCVNCGEVFQVSSENQYVFNSQHRNEELPNQDWLNRLKEKVKTRYPKLYPYLVDFISPVHMTYRVESFLASTENREVTLNLGSGVSYFGPDVINVDIAPYSTVQIVSTLEKLPIRSNCADAIVNIAVLEHVPDPEKVIGEFLRVLKPGGKLFCFIPFIQGFHASPYDFKRFTIEGVKNLFPGFEIESLKPGGPTSGMLWVVQEWIAIVLSFGSAKLYKAIFPLTWILFPLKFLDIIVAKHPHATNIATGHFLVARKPI